VLVDGDRVLGTPGGKEGAIAALDRSTGRLLWQAKEITEDAHYSSIQRAVFHGRPQYVQLMEKRLVGVSPENGKLLWEAPFPGGNVAVIPTPVIHNGKVFATAGYGAGCILVEIEADNTAKVIYDNNIMKNHHGGVVLVGQHLYGHSDDVGWICMDFNTGRRVWRDEESFDKGALTYADGLFYCLGESDGQEDASVALVEPSTEGWKERSRFQLSPQSKNRKSYDRVWTHPVIAYGKLYLRDQDMLYCYDIKTP
jgi:outer membrane protein assembly factor BamB